MDMNWKFKALLQKSFSYCPFRHDVYFQFQKRIQRSLPYSERTLTNRLKMVRLHEAFLTQFRSLSSLRILEVGAGWDLFFGFTMRTFGVQNIFSWDINPLFKPEIFNANLAWAEQVHGRPFPRLTAQWRKELQELYGIQYLNAKSLDKIFEFHGPVDAVCSTSVLEHIPEVELDALLRTLKRRLPKGAVISSIIDLSDHFSHGDRKIDAYNFLRYPRNRFWGNNRFVYQNRLRKSDYLKLFERHGFDTVMVNEDAPDVDFAAEIFPTLHSDFRSYAPDDLKVTFLHIGARA